MQIEQRVEEQIAYFNRKSGVCKKWYYIFTCITAVGSIFVTALIQLEEFGKIGATVVSLIVASAAAINNIMNYASKWRLYRTTAEKLEREQSFFDNEVDCYKGKPLSLYAKNVEAILSDTNTTWADTVFKKDKEQSNTEE